MQHCVKYYLRAKLYISNNIYWFFCHKGLVKDHEVQPYNTTFSNYDKSCETNGKVIKTNRQTIFTDECISI